MGSSSFCGVKHNVDTSTCKINIYICFIANRGGTKHSSICTYVA